MSTSSKAIRRLKLLGAGAAFAAAIQLFGAVPASAANWFEQNWWLSGPRYDAQIPPCDTPAALSKIRDRFSIKEGRFWNSDLSIVEIGAIKQVAFRPWAEGSIPRRFCAGKVLISDGKWRPVYYSIIEDSGMIGASWGVEWCVVGLDRNMAYSPSCKMARP